MKPTKEAYQELQRAYDHFNRSLFQSKLPACLITMQRERSAYGYFSGGRWKNRVGAITDEIALNPAHFADRGDEHVLSTLVHEMVHLWQHHFGSPGRGRYHNRQWAEKMEAVGLYPSSTAAPGGNRTGDSMSHYIIKDAGYAAAYRKLSQTGFKLTWMDRVGDVGGANPKQTRQKFSCPKCGLNAWAKPDAKLLCGTCQKTMRP